MRQAADYDFDLPADSIAQVPAEKRDASRLLHLLAHGEIQDCDVLELVDLLPDNAVLVVNDTKVIRARLHTQKPTGGAVELLLLEPLAQDNQWRCLAKSSKALRDATPLRICGTEIFAQTQGERASDGSVVVTFPGDVYDLLEAHGELPLPPYIARPQGDSPADRKRYQTVYAKEHGAVAAPTAGLHFSEELLAKLAAKGITRTSLTLHVGLGTFAPVREEALQDIRLHEERYEISPQCAKLIASGRPIVAVGTTVVRALESAATHTKTVAPGAGRTAIFISPGYSFQIVDHLITNFHLPKSTLLMLVCAFAGYQPILDAYKHAVAAGYRFYSYGDAMLLHATKKS